MSTNKTFTEPWRFESNGDNFYSSGLPCHMQRGPIGAWCGYVGVRKGHPLYKVHYSTPSPILNRLSNRPVHTTENWIGLICHVFNDSNDMSPDVAFNVHGGLTYSDTPCWTASPTIWWFGFDCSHCDDYTPGLAEFMSIPLSSYRNMEYVRNEVINLARQLREVERYV